MILAGARAPDASAAGVLAHPLFVPVLAAIATALFTILFARVAERWGWVDDGAEVLTIKGLGGNPLSVGFSPDGRRILAEVRKPDQREDIRTWDARDGRAELTIPVARRRL